ncbi:glycoside hydrolase family 28 protein [Pelomonas sp. KK5]|uniref:glycoside hydrolase family 28 protein n=1 Tax=Pelomonas sp. KK5 TaxID=1855730 RepID=UPI00097C92C0|nr:glycoside hydrolase family 28 protein [Pelomonas sp. KK5]
MSRRALLKLAPVLGLASLPAVADEESDPWQQAQAIVDRFAAQPLVFRDEDFPITAHGAKPARLVPATAWISFTDEAAVQTPAPDATDCYPAIKAAIAACHAAGGGRVVIPAGAWYVAGPIVLLSNVHLHLQAGAHVYFSNRPSDYAKYGVHDCGPNGKLTLCRWEGNDLLNYSPLVYAYGQKNIALTGEDHTAILDGQAGLKFADGPDCWWSWKGRERMDDGSAPRHVPHSGRTEVHLNPNNPTSLREAAPHLSAEEAAFIQGKGGNFRRDADFLRALAEARVPKEKRIFGIGHYLRPQMVQVIDCTDVLFEGYQSTNTPFWQHNPVGCRNVHVRRLLANSMGPNNDGFDPEACDGVLIEDSEFNTGDDCIAIDSGKGPDTQYGPAQNIVVQNCRMHSGHGALTFGSIMSGGIQNVYAQNLVFENSHWKSDPLNVGIRLKCSMSRGGFLRNLHIRNIQIPNGIRTTPGMYRALPGSLVPDRTVAVSAGAVIAIDCGYDATLDKVRTRPPIVTNVRISNVTVGRVPTPSGPRSSYQAIVILGPIASDYNGPAQPAPQILPVSDIVVRDCDLGTPVLEKQPIYLFNTRGLVLKNVRIGAKVYNETLSS